MKFAVIFSIALIPFIAKPAAAQSTASDRNAVCRIPFEKIVDPKTGAPFPLSSAVNANTHLPKNLRQRYIVADFNTVDANGKCRGVEESFTAAEKLTDFNLVNQLASFLKTKPASFVGLSIDDLYSQLNQIDSPEDQIAAQQLLDENSQAISIELEDLANYLKSVAKFHAKSIRKARVFNNYCVGESLNYCEIIAGRPTLVYRFITSSYGKHMPLPKDYYAPINYIHTRHWSSDRPYTKGDAARDQRLGGGDAKALPFQNGGHPIEMPNFMNFLPMPGYKGETQNGIHQIAGGLDSGGTFGAPVSLGCVRLNKFQAKLSRWWTPMQAKFFIYLERDRYLKFGDSKTGFGLEN